MPKRFAIVAVLSFAQAGCIVLDVPPHLPAVDVIAPLADTCVCGDGICNVGCHESASTCPDDCPTADATGLD